jgi:glutathione peroxidase
MKSPSYFLFLAVCICVGLCVAFASAVAADSIYDVEVKTLEGKKQTLAEHKGKVMLFVNTASKCGFTPQYRDLEVLYEKYSQQGFVVLGFPSNDFMGQEPGTNEEIKTFCKVRYGVTFPLFDKGPVTGDQIQPVYKRLLQSAPEELKSEIGWNFEKIVVDKKGVVRGRFGSVVNPMNARVTSLVESLLVEAKG